MEQLDGRGGRDGSKGKERRLKNNLRCYRKEMSINVFGHEIEFQRDIKSRYTLYSCEQESEKQKT